MHSSVSFFTLLTTRLTSYSFISDASYGDRSCLTGIVRSSHVSCASDVRWWMGAISEMAGHLRPVEASGAPFPDCAVSFSLRANSDGVRKRRLRHDCGCSPSQDSPALQAAEHG